MLVTAWGCTKHLLRINVSRAKSYSRNSSLRRGYVLETLLCPCAGLLNTSGLCPKTLLVSSRLGEGAATGSLVTHHQAGERERQSKQTVRLRGFRPDTPSQSMLYLRKEYQPGSPRSRPVRPWALALPLSGDAVPKRVRSNACAHVSMEYTARPNLWASTVSALALPCWCARFAK